MDNNAYDEYEKQFQKNSKRNQSKMPNNLEKVQSFLEQEQHRKTDDKLSKIIKQLDQQDIVRKNAPKEHKKKKKKQKEVEVTENTSTLENEEPETENKSTVENEGTKTLAILKTLVHKVPSVQKKQKEIEVTEIKSTLENEEPKKLGRIRGRLSKTNKQKEQNEVEVTKNKSTLENQESEKRKRIRGKFSKINKQKKQNEGEVSENESTLENKEPIERERTHGRLSKINKQREQKEPEMPENKSTLENEESEKRKQIRGKFSKINKQMEHNEAEVTKNESTLGNEEPEKRKRIRGRLSKLNKQKKQNKGEVAENESTLENEEPRKRKRIRGRLSKLNKQKKQNEEEVTKNESTLESAARKKRKRVRDMQPKQIFVKYINKILSKIFGEQQQDMLETHKCLPVHIDDLESYALMLSQSSLGNIVERKIRISSKNIREAFVILSNGREANEKDAIIPLPVARHYAYDGDTVRAFVFNMCTTTSNISDKCPNAFVIKIIKSELEETVGLIHFKHKVESGLELFYQFRPFEIRLPTVYIPVQSCRKEAKVNKKHKCHMVYVAKLLCTDKNGNRIGELVRLLGRFGDLDTDIKAILLNNGLKNIEPYEQKFNEMYEGSTLMLNEEILKSREDLRNICIFTIDPLTAKDLDDAVSVEKVIDTEYEVGVHISDVSYYLEENSDLDNLVKERATSIYMVNEVIHMLPLALCHKSSLLPGEDKLAFSVFWKWNTEREEFSTPRFTRSVVNSCSQFAYEHAQKIVDYPNDDFDSNGFPQIFNDWTLKDIQWRILFLHKIAKKLKAQRYENGALSIKNPKLHFELNLSTGEPLSYEIECRREANFLIEEFMLLANQSVAKFIHECFPDISILRNHSPPSQRSLEVLKNRLNNTGLVFDISSSKSIYESVQRLIREATDAEAMEVCLSNLLTKPMTRALYYCSEGKNAASDFRHYALSVPIYTHFTSPIRRYPDVLVHRVLAAALNYCPPPQRTSDELHEIAAICSNQQYKAKCAGNDSIELFYMRYIKNKGSIKVKAVVSEIFKNDLSAVTIDSGYTIVIKYNSKKLSVDTTNVPAFVLISRKNSIMPPKKLQMFSTIDVTLTINLNKIIAEICLE